MTNIESTVKAETQVPVLANLDDINQEHACRAFSGTSFDPEKRGESRRHAYVDAVNGLYAELWTLAETEMQQSTLAAEMERYRQGYLTRMNAYLSSHSNVISAMITGPARFPTARNQKRGQWADNKLADLYAWEEKGRDSIRRKIVNLAPKRLAELKGLGEAETIAQGEGVKIIANPQADRVQIMFDGKPEPEMIAKLRGAAWNWSPSNKAWQRKLTDAAKLSAKRITGAA